MPFFHQRRSQKYIKAAMTFCVAPIVTLTAMISLLLRAGLLFLAIVHCEVNAQWHGALNSVGKPPVIAGLDDMRPLDMKNCVSAAFQQARRVNPKLSSPAECARSCHKGAPPKTCYYNFVVEYYAINSIACQVCQPNATTTFCNQCQCVPADGVERMAMTVNRMIPGPAIEVCLGDYVVIDVENRMRGADLTIHWHGVFQKGSQYYDGVPFLTQCPVQEGTTFRYQWGADNSGTHFWHAHTAVQKMDGIFGALVIREPDEKDRHSSFYDYDLSKHVVVINDWFHAESTSRYPGRLVTERGQDPEAVLINGKGQYIIPNTKQITNTSLEVFTVKRGYRYRFRLVNSFCTTCPGLISIEDHSLTVITTDGQGIQPVQVDSIVSFAGERYDFVLNADKPPGTYWIQLRGIGLCEENRIQQWALLRYENGPKEPKRRRPSYYDCIPQGVVLNPLDGNCNKDRNDAICLSSLKSAIPVDNGILRQVPDMKIYLPIGFYIYPNLKELFRPNIYKRFLVNGFGSPMITLIDGITFDFPPSPPISQLNDIPPNTFCNDTSLPRNCGADCRCTHKIDIPYNAIVEVILVDEFQGPNVSHPFHLHGHAFHIMSMGRPQKNETKSMTLEYALQLDQRNLITRYFDLPPAKDTVPVPNNGYLIFRFRADNPGYWLFHCHFIYHQMVGMDLILHVGEQKDLPPVPQNFPKCGNHLPPINPHRYIENKQNNFHHITPIVEYPQPVEPSVTRRTKLPGF